MVTPADAATRAATTYNATADVYDHPVNSFWDRFGRRTVDRLELRPGARVLDVCCGSGASAIPAAEAAGPAGSVLGVDLAVQQRKTFQVLKWVGLQHRMNASPDELSGGEQQRIAIARALVNEPQLVLADEPTGNLDPDLSLEIMNLFREINARGTTVIVATHDRELIRRVGRRTVTLEQGRIVEVV